MVRFRLPTINSDLRAYFSHFKKGIFTIVGFLVIAALIAGSFIYGNRQNEEVANQPRGSQEQSGEATQSPDGNESYIEDNSPSAANDNGQRSSAGSGSSSQRRSSSAQTRPNQVPNTGAEDFLAPIAAMGVILVARKYRASKQALNQAQLG